MDLIHPAPTPRATSNALMITINRTLRTLKIGTFATCVQIKMVTHWGV